MSHPVQLQRKPCVKTILLNCALIQNISSDFHTITLPRGDFVGLLNWTAIFNSVRRKEKRVDINREIECMSMDNKLQTPRETIKVCAHIILITTLVV